VPVAAGCPGQSLNAFIQVNPTPVVNFAMNTNNGCSPLYVSFATNTLTFGNPDSLVFSWGDGTPNSVLYPNPIQPIWSTIEHVFVNNTFNAVTYTIALTASNECGDTTVYQNVTVQPNTIDAFFTPSVTSGCEPLTVQFNDFSTGSSYSSWCFNYNLSIDSCIGNSVVVTPGTSVSNTFMAGTYTIALYITDGCSQDTAFSTIIVNPSPISDFTFTNNVCKDAPVTFNQGATPSPGTFLTAYEWSFGDGDTAIGSFVSHSYESAAVYIACLTTYGSNGCSSTICKPVTIISKPVVDFLAYDTCVNTQPVQFINNSIGATFYQWDFGNGNVSVLKDPANNFLQPGTYTVKLVGSTNSCIDSISKTVVIYPKPTAAFSLTSNYSCGEPSSVSITNLSTGAFGYYWDFGNNTYSTATNPTATYNAAGSYDISLIASNQFGCFDTALSPVTIYPFPVVNSIDIDPEEGCQPLQITVTTNADNGNLYIWNFGDGTSNVSLTTPTATYTYSDTGIYTVQVWVYSYLDCGDTVLLSDTVKVYINPIADFDIYVNTTVEPIDGTVIFTNNSQHSESYLWDFGDGFSSTVESPIHKYEEVDSFYATLYAYNSYGCVDSISKSFFVFKRSLWVPNAFAPDFGGGNELVQIWKPIGIGLRYYRAQVFNTWGELMWESTKLEDTKPAEGWDGTYRGNMCQQDVYVWKVEAVFLDGVRWEGMAYEIGDKRKTIGSVTLIR
jgi:PKD repeat protein